MGFLPITLTSAENTWEGTLLLCGKKLQIIETPGGCSLEFFSRTQFSATHLALSDWRPIRGSVADAVDAVCSSLWWVPACLVLCSTCSCIRRFLERVLSAHLAFVLICLWCTAAGANSFVRKRIQGAPHCDFRVSINAANEGRI